MKIKKLCFLAVLGLLAAGCVSVGRKLDQSKVDQITKGKTTKQEVVDLVGPPNQVTRDSAGVVTFTYAYSKSSVKGETFIPFAGGFVGGANVENQLVTVRFDTNNVVLDVVSTYGATGTSGLNGNAQNAADFAPIQ